MMLNRAILDQIAGEYGDSFYLLDSRQFRSNFLNLQLAFQKIYLNTQIAYSYKTNYTPKLCKIVDELGGYAEIVSDMEWEIAQKVGVQPQKVIFNGPYKTKAAMEALLIAGGTVNLDAAYELPIIAQIADEHPNTMIHLGVRCNFDIGDGGISRFGFDVASDEFREAMQLMHSRSNLHFNGLHCHFATRRLETWAPRANQMAELAKQIPGGPPERLDLGGGLFGNMGSSLKAQFDSYIPNFAEYAQAAAAVIAQHFPGEDKPMLFIEPGSALAGDAMKFAAKVINIKTVRGKQVATLLGSIYNINPTLNKKNPPITIYPTARETATVCHDLDFSGFTCIENDYLFRGYSGPLGTGDYVVFDNVGSYSIVLKPPFILPNFAVVDYDEQSGAVELVKAAETFDDLFHTFQF